MLFDRMLKKELLSAARKMPVITLIGPRQSGKTTLAKNTFPDYEYISIERPDIRAEVIDDPRGFLSRINERAILDEVQRAPDLLSYIQPLVDDRDFSGCFILTGSQNFLLMERVSQTLAGRTAVFYLLPLSISELYRRDPFDPTAMAHDSGRCLTILNQNLWETLWTGFYPRIHDKDLDPARWLADYHRTYVERDLRDTLKVMNLDAFERFVRLAAARTGQVLNMASLADDAGISQPTVRQWLTSLRIGSLITLLKPHHANFQKRLRKRPKLHFLDTGLACYLLGIRDADTLSMHPLRGAVFESFVVGELTKIFVHHGRQAPLYHWRDVGGHEIDIVIDLGSELLPVEVKAGMTLSSDTLKGLRWWTGLPKNPNSNGILVHGGTETRRLGGFTVLPWYLS